MPSGIIVEDLIKSSMRLFGGLAAGETPDADEAQDGLDCLNDLLENWSTETLSVWASANQTFTTSPGVATYTIGPGATWNTNRPIAIDAAYCVFQNVSFNIRTIEQQFYNALAQKTLALQIPERLLYVSEFPFGLVTLWPVPTLAIPITLTMGRILQTPVALGDTLSGPPGFVKAVKYCLAVEFAPEFGVSATPDVVQIASDAKADFQRSNIKMNENSYDPAIAMSEVALFLRGY